MTTFAIYDGLDPRLAPLYSIADVARFVGLPQATLRSWVAGRSYPRSDGPARFERMIDPADRQAHRLSFTNLVEAHVLRAIRRVHGVPIVKVRKALEYAQGKLSIDRLLVHRDLLTAGGELFLRHVQDLVNLSQSGQLAMERLLAAHLRRVDHDREGRPIRLFPFVQGDGLDAQRRVVIDPRLAFGRPTVSGKGIATEIVADRFDSGETIASLARDYGLGQEEIEEAILYERAA